jgi:hypothetical protein
MMAVNEGDVLMLAPWIIFGGSLAFIYAWLRKPLRSSRRRAKHSRIPPPRRDSDEGKDAEADPPPPEQTVRRKPENTLRL